MSEGTKEFNAQEEIERLKRMFEDGEKAMELAQQRMAGLAEIVFQMDMFLRDMIKIGVFEEAVRRLETEEKPKLII
jgi:hypothetical protein